MNTSEVAMPVLITADPKAVVAVLTDVDPLVVEV